MGSSGQREMAAAAKGTGGGQPGKVLLSRRQIQRRVAELGQEIQRSYGQRPVTLLAVMSGAIVFLADLLRQLSLEVQLRVLCARRYEQGVNPGAPQLAPCLEADLAGQDVLIVDDILDRGATLSTIVDQVLARRPASLKTCLLLRKIRPAMADAQELAARKANLEFVGFEIPEVFVVGYGLDFNGRYRNLPDIVILQQQEGRP